MRIQYNRIDIDVRKGETRTKQFLDKISSNGQVPVVIIPTNYVHNKAKSPTSSTSTTLNPSSSTATTNVEPTILTESNAIFNFFSDGTLLYPSNPIKRAKIMQWLFWEQFSHGPNFSSLRTWLTLLNKGEDPQYLDQINERQIKGYEALEIMEKHLSKENWFVANKYTIADIALYVHTHCAEEGKFYKKYLIFAFKKSIINLFIYFPF